jgi:hypothetical protein
VIAVSVSILIFSIQTASQQRPAGKKAARMRIIKGPALESAEDNSAVVNGRPTRAAALGGRSHTINQFTTHQHP